MNIEANDDHLIVISDLHLGHPASMARARLISFLDHVRDLGASVCVNGDGFDMLQTTFKRLAHDAIPVMNRLKAIQSDGANIYYVVGNHDIVLEHFLEDWALTRLSPFINLTSGDRRVRIEHGHLYDPFFAQAPGLYEWSVRLARFAYFAVPDVYKLWNKSQQRLQHARRARVDDPKSKASPYHDAAAMILRRGFDGVIFGHTHFAEMVELPEGTYANSGDWLTNASYVEIKKGHMTVCHWNDGLASSVSAPAH